MLRHTTLALAMFSGVIHAQDSVTLDPVQITATRNAAQSFDTSLPVTVVGAEQLAEKRPQVMAEALRGEAGVYFQQTGAGQGMAIVRGLKGAEVLHLVDGFRLNNAFFRTAPSQYVALIDPFSLAQIEVLRGPYSTLYGSDAMGGVVQLRTANPAFAGDDVRTQHHLHLRAGSADEGLVGRYAHAVGNEQLWVQAGVTRARYGGRIVGGEGQVADGMGNISRNARVGPTSYQTSAYDLKTQWQPAKGHRLTATVQYFSAPDIPRYNEVVPGSKPITAPGAAAENPARAQSVYNNAREFYLLRYEADAPIAGVDSLQVSLGRQRMDDDRFDLRRNLTRAEIEENRSTLDGLSVVGSTLLGAHALTYGTDLYRDNVASHKFRSNDAGLSYTANSPSSSFKSRFPNGAVAEDYGLYVQDQWRATPSLTLTAGARASRSTVALPAAPESDRPNGGTIDNANASGQMGLRWGFAEGLAFTANVGRAYRAPNVNDLAAVGDRSNGRVVVANTGLQPESLISADAGIKFLRKGLRGEVTLFGSQYRDRITLLNNVPNGSQGCTEAAGCAQNQNIAKARYYGVESALRWRIAPTLSARGSLNYTHAEQENNGVTEPGNRTPPLNAALALHWQALDSLELEPQAWINASQRRLDTVDKADNRIANGGTAGFAVFHLGARWQPVGAVWSLHALAENLLDKSYREHGSGIDGRGRGISLALQADW